MSRKITLSVRSGRHRGAQVDLPADSEITLGREAGCGLVLSDDGIADNHLSLRLDRRNLVVTSLDAPVDVPGRGQVEPGFRARLSNSIDLRAGPVDLRIDMPKGAMARLPVGIGTVAVVAGLAMVAVLGTRLPLGQAEAAIETPVLSQEMAAAAAPAVPVPPVATAASRPEPAAAPAAPPAAAPIEETPPDRDAIAAELTTRLAEIGFGHLSLDAGLETFTLSGRVPADQRETFRRFQTWFDDKHPRMVLQTSAVTFPKTIEEAVQPPAIESVWTMGDPYIVVDGRRYYGGDKVPNGWRLERIEDERAIFSEGGQTYRVALGGEPAEADPERQVAAK